jgi:DNA polymerase III subunit delta'
VLAVQVGASVELANEPRAAELRRLAAQDGPGATVRRIESILRCRQRLQANAAPLLAVEELTLALR